MRLLRTRPRPSRAGLSLIELIFVVGILVLLARALVESSESMSQLSSSNNTRALLMEQGHDAMQAMLGDLRRSGIRDIGGVEYPFIFERGDPDDLAFDDHEHTPAQQSAEVGDPDFGVPHSIVFVLPANLDGDDRPDLDGDLDGVPELDGDGDGILSESWSDTNGIWDPFMNTIDPDNGLVWNHTEISYVTATGPDGVNYLERRVNADPDSAQRVARDIELLTIETAADTGFAIPTNAIRVRMFFRKLDKRGVLYRHSVEVVISLRNGELEFDA